MARTRLSVKVSRALRSEMEMESRWPGAVIPTYCSVAVPYIVHASHQSNLFRSKQHSILMRPAMPCMCFEASKRPKRPIALVVATNSRLDTRTRRYFQRFLALHLPTELLFSLVTEPPPAQVIGAAGACACLHPTCLWGTGSGRTRFSASVPILASRCR